MEAAAVGMACSAADGVVNEHRGLPRCADGAKDQAWGTIKEPPGLKPRGLKVVPGASTTVELRGLSEPPPLAATAHDACEGEDGEGESTRAGCMARSQERARKGSERYGCICTAAIALWRSGLHTVLPVEVGRTRAGGVAPRLGMWMAGAACCTAAVATAAAVAVAVCGPGGCWGTTTVLGCGDLSLSPALAVGIIIGVDLEEVKQLAADVPPDTLGTLVGDLAIRGGADAVEG